MKLTSMMVDWVRTPWLPKPSGTPTTAEKFDKEITKEIAKHQRKVGFPFDNSGMKAAEKRPRTRFSMQSGRFLSVTVSG